MALPLDVPEWLLMRGITTIQVTALALVNGSLDVATGVAGVVGPFDFFTTVMEVNWNLEVETARVGPATAQSINNVVLARGRGFTLREMLRLDAAAAGFSKNSLADLFETFRHFRVIFTRAAKTFTGYYANGGYDEAQARESGTGLARFLPISTVEAATTNTFANVSNVEIS